MKKLYSLDAVRKYLDPMEDFDIVEIPGSLLDNYIIFHGYAIEIFKETYLNEWSSAYTRHIYRKRVPKSIIEWINQEIEDRTAQYKALLGDNYILDIEDECYDLEYAKRQFEDFNNRFEYFETEI